MKKIIIIIFISVLGISSCNEDALLTEVPKDFLTPENSFTTKEGFESAIAAIYEDNRWNLYENYMGHPWLRLSMMGLDADLYDLYMATSSLNTVLNWNTFNADNGWVRTFWQAFYRMIFKANTIIDRADMDVVEWDSEEEKNAIVAEARFLRAFYYTFLANMWGGVPLVLEETSEAKFDFTRASQAEVYNQCVEDLLFATSHMNTVDQIKGGRAPRAAAYHLLAQVYIQMGMYQEAINAASAVIDDPNYQLMTERFGRYKDFMFNGYDYQGEYEPWGDVYWDLFRDGNFNRIDGNMECIWNIQMDYEIPGGGKPNLWGNFLLEYCFGGPATFNMKDINGTANWRKDTLGGSPVGWYNLSDYAGNQIWQYKDDWNKDIRNSKYNIQREWYFTNPEGEFYGQLITPDNMWDPANFDVWAAPSLKKAVTAVHYGGRKLHGEEEDDAGRSFKDWYIMRLAETYLLRAEAYHLNGDNAKAAADINEVRNRAQATPVNAGEVDLDLILDERARELIGEEFRQNTLMRMGKLPEYIMKYNGIVLQEGYQLGDHLNKFPIPNSEIEANKEAVLEQNPGY